MLGFLSVPTGVAYLIVTALAHLLTPLGAGLATAAAIVFLTAAVRLLLFPLSYHAFRGQARLTALQPKIADLRTRWARQPDRLQAELTALYRAEGGGLLAGCLPMLVQLPFFSVLYHLVESRVIEGRPNGLLTSNLLTTLAREPLADRGRAAEQPGADLRRPVRAAGRRCLPERPGDRGRSGHVRACRQPSAADQGAAVRHRGGRRGHAAGGRAVPADDHRLDGRGARRPEPPARCAVGPHYAAGNTLTVPVNRAP